MLRLASMDWDHLTTRQSNRALRNPARRLASAARSVSLAAFSELGRRQNAATPSPPSVSLLGRKAKAGRGRHQDGNAKLKAAALTSPEQGRSFFTGGTSSAIRAPSRTALSSKATRSAFASSAAPFTRCRNSMAISEAAEKHSGSTSSLSAVAGQLAKLPPERSQLPPLVWKSKIANVAIWTPML